MTAWASWRLKRWGMVSTIVLRVLDGLAAVPGIFVAPSLGLQVGATVAVILSLVVIWLLLVPTARRAMA